MKMERSVTDGKKEGIMERSSLFCHKREECFGMLTNNTLWIAVRVIVSCFVFAYFVFVPFKTRFRFPYLHTAVLTGGLIAVTVLLTILFLTPESLMAEYSTVGIIVWIVTALLFFCIAIKGSYFEILFIVLVVLNLYVNIMAIAKVIVGELAQSYHQEIIRNMVSMLVLAAYLPLLNNLTKLYQQVIEFNIQLSFWRTIWSIPTLTYLIFYVKIVRDYWKKAYDLEFSDMVFVILWSFATYVFFWVTLQMLSQTYRGITAREEAALMSSQLRMQEEQYRNLLENLEKNARLRHDWRHHLLLLDGFAQRKDIAGMQNYLRQLMPVYTSEGDWPVCENHIADVILRHWAAIAKAEGISMNIFAGIPKELSIDPTDICIIFGNLVENALEACRNQKDGEKWVTIRAEMKGRQLIAVFRNTCGSPVFVRRGVYYSTKHEGPGTGLASVRHVAEKYGGVLEISHQNGEFCVKVLLNEGALDGPACF